MAAAATLDLLNFDAGYLGALRRGEPETQQHFFDYFKPLIRRKLRKHLRAPELIEEATQETFVRVLAAVRSRSGVRHPERFGAFVHAVCRNVALETWRAERRFVPIDEIEQTGPGPFRSPHAIAEAGEAHKIVTRVLADLSPLDRELLEAVFLDEEERDLLCRRLGVTRGHLRVLLHRARQRFASHGLTQDGQPESTGIQRTPDRAREGQRHRKAGRSLFRGGLACELPL